MTQNNQLTKNLLICGDNLKALNDLKKQATLKPWLQGVEEDS